LNREWFDTVARKFLDVVSNAVTTKGDEYSDEGVDRLANFKTGAVHRRTVPEDYLMSLVAKHDVWIEDQVENIARAYRNRHLSDSGHTYILDLNMKSEDLWLEHLKDRAVYALLLFAVLSERGNWGLPPTTSSTTGVGAGTTVKTGKKTSSGVTGVEV
jgi:hypothetical protein